MRYAGLKYNDTEDGEGLVVSLWTQGCPHCCDECHNPGTWNPEGGYEIPEDIEEQIIKAISANGIKRNFSVLGGEPLVSYNQQFVLRVVDAVRQAFPHIKIYLWTGYTLEELLAQNSAVVSSILEKIDVLIDGRFEKNKKDLKLKLRGSSNQRILERGKDF